MANAIKLLQPQGERVDLVLESWWSSTAGIKPVQYLGSRTRMRTHTRAGHSLWRPSGCMSVSAITSPYGRGNHRRHRIRVVHPLKFVRHDGPRRIVCAHPRKISILVSA
jgi:hypothetical protein